MNIIALDLNLYAQRGVLITPDGTPITHYVGRPNETCSTWLNRVLRGDPNVAIVGSPLDDWPTGLVQLIRGTGAELHWLNPILMRRLYSICRPWNLQRKLHKARFLAYLHQIQATPWDAEKATRDFERLTAHDLLNL